MLVGTKISNAFKYTREALKRIRMIIRYFSRNKSSPDPYVSREINASKIIMRTSASYKSMMQQWYYL